MLCGHLVVLDKFNFSTVEILSNLMKFGSFVVVASAVNALMPLVFWHGMGDTCCDGIINLIDNLKEWYPGIYAHSIMIGNSLKNDRKASFFGKIALQVQSACDQLKNIPELAEGFDAIGFSQGGLFLRGYVEQCNDPPVRNLITFGSPHGGTSDIPNCEKSHDLNCSLMRSIVKNGVYWKWVQNKVIAAQFFKKWNDVESYLSKNIYLPDLNNELQVF